MEIENKQRNLDDILSAAERIIKAREEEVHEDLFGHTVSNTVLNEIKEIFDSVESDNHDPKTAHGLYYGVIKRLVLKAMPKSDIRDLVQLLTCNLLTEIELLRKGDYRGQDSRQQPNEKLNEVADIIITWSERPYDYMRLAQILLDECIKKGISPKERTLADFIH